VVLPSVLGFQPTSIRPVRPAGPVVGRPIRPRRLHAPFHHEPDNGGEILLRSDGKEKGSTSTTLAPGLSRRPCAAAHSLGPSVFTLRAEPRSTDRASVSQAVASRGAPPLPAMSLGTCGCCRRKHNGCVREGEGGWAWTRRNLVCGRPGSRRRSGAQAGVAVLLAARPVRRGTTVCRQINPWNCSAGEAPLPEPSRARLPAGIGARDRGGWCHRTGKPRNCPLTKDDCPSRSCDRRQDPRAACEWSSRISLDG